ncbi:APS8, partial [Tolypocladium paradoxum]
MTIPEIHSHGANNVKSKVYQVLVHGAPNVLTIRRKEEHAWRRRILSLALSDATVLSYERILKRHIDVLCENMEDNATSNRGTCREVPLDMSQQSDYFTFDIMSEVIFGMKFNALKKETYRFVAKALEDSNIRISTLVQAPILTIGRLDKHLFPASIQGRNKFLGFITSLLRNRSAASFSDNGNVFSFLESAKDPDGGKTLDKSQIRAECATLVVAGSDTSSSTLAATLFYLSGNPEAYARVCREVRGKFETHENIGMGVQLNSCTYLRACIDEALRMSPPVGGALWREVGPGGMTVDSLFLPGGIDVGVGIYSLHHNDKYHKDPFKYLPERWLVGESSATKESVELSRSAFVPFSSGPRSCVGKGFAYHEMTLTLANIIHRFDFTRAENSYMPCSIGTGPGGEAEFLLRDHVTGAKSGPYLKFR